MFLAADQISSGFTGKVVVVLLFLEVVLWTTAYSVSACLGKMKYPALFLSASIDKDPMRAFACVLGPVIAVLTGFVLCARSILMKSHIVTITQLRLWKLFNISSIVTCFTIMLVPALPYSFNPFLHMTVAFLLFLSGLLIVLTSYRLDSLLNLPTSTMVRRARLALVCLMCTGSLAFAVSFFINPLMSSIFEMVAVVSMNGYICTFAHTNDFFPINTNQPAQLSFGSSRKSSNSNPVSTAYTEDIPIEP